MSKIDYYNKRVKSLRVRINVLTTLLDEMEQRLHAEETIDGLEEAEAGDELRSYAAKLANRLRAEMNVGGYKRGIYAQIVIKHCEKLLRSAKRSAKRKGTA